ncbi:MAG: molybdopterin-dependent oxidoreductase, partial [Proteobacteria bacterium]|nr:molybdopterin-dependent oxidoreductase [Pseudomonadota bacterium]
KKGGIFAVAEPDYINWPEIEMDDSAAAGMQKGRLDGAGSKKYPFSRHLLNRLPQAVNSGEKYPLKALFVAGANPLYTMSDSKAVKKAFDKVPFVVSFSSYMDETAQNADLILPNHAYLERYEDIPTPAGMPKPVIGLSRPVVEPQFNTKHTGDVIILLAKAMGGNIADAFAWNSYDECLKETLGYKWRVMVEKGFWSYPDFFVQTHEKSFDTVSGKFEFAPKETGSLKQFKPVNIEGDKTNYPLLLIPYDSIRLANGVVGDPPFVMKSVDDTVLKGTDVFIELNPKTAGEHGLREGQLAMLSTPVGKARVKVHLFDGIMPGLVALPRGLGHTAFDDYLAGKGINFNELIGPVEDSVSGLDAAWGIRVKLAKA